ncbi:MAG: TorD/DmsD family molecular chaperone [Gammaproteobacteria bacterium]
MPTPSDRSLHWRWLAAAFTYPDEEIRRWLGDSPTPESYLSLFGHTVRGDCPPHEIEYGELKADPLFQPHRLADIAAFYTAFGLEVAPDANERVDHIAMECEFFSVLCAKEAYALGNSRENVEICRDAQKKFLREHLARWTPAFSRRVERLAGDEFYRQAARQLREAVEAECARHGLQPGNADIQLRPVEELVDPCGACGLVNRE